MGPLDNGLVLKVLRHDFLSQVLDDTGDCLVLGLYLLPAPDNGLVIVASRHELLRNLRVREGDWGSARLNRLPRDVVQIDHLVRRD